MFSLAAPVGAIVTYLLVHLFGGDNANPDAVGYWTGAVLLFSGGSFLFVGGCGLVSPLTPATVIQPISETGPDGMSASRSSSIPLRALSPPPLTVDHCHNQHHLTHSAQTLAAGPRTALMLVGMALPVGLAFLVGHHD